MRLWVTGNLLSSEKFLMFLRLAIVSLALLGMGCSSGGGRAGDANDPALTTDKTALSDETGSIGEASNGKAKPKK